MRIAPLALLLIATVAQAQTKPAAPAANPISQSLRAGYDRIKQFLNGAAEAMPAEQYDFKPTPAVRSFGQIVGHVIDAQYAFCSSYKKEKAPTKGSIEKTVTGKPALKKALADAFAYCDAAYASS